jgi:hypothetical protein
MGEQQASNGQATNRRAVRAWLDVPYPEKDEAKGHGARWDPRVGRWYDPNPPTAGLQRWLARPEVPELLPGEDRAFGAGLFVDMVPATCWFTNVRGAVSQQDWERLRRMVLRRAEQRCEVCGRGPDRDIQRWLEVHERWHYDDTVHTQTLRRLICLCTDCHETTHLGLANVRGRADQAVAHLRAVTGMTTAQASQHIVTANELWITRSRRTWALDLSMLTDAGITLAQPEDPAARVDRAHEQLAAAKITRPEA